MLLLRPVVSSYPPSTVPHVPAANKMTEGCEEKDSLVRVRAQVMTRDDSSGGWVPMDGGGLSNVSVRKRILPVHSPNSASVVANNNATNIITSRGSSTSGPGPPPSPKGLLNNITSTIPVCHCNNIIQQHEYLILGKRISDQTIVLSCTIRKDFQYNKVMPTFHHWRTGDQKFGLTFQTAADARAFDKGVRMAVEDLLDGLADAPTALRHMNSDASEDDVFMTLDLPMERSELQSSPAPSLGPQQSTTHTPITKTPPPLPKEPHLHRIHFVRRPLPPSSSTTSLPLLNNSINEGLRISMKDHSISPDQRMWQQRDQELAMIRERERAAKEKERQRREREGIWSSGVGGIGGGGGLLNDHIELDKESYSYVQFAREGVVGGPGVGGVGLHSLSSDHEYSYPVMPDPATSSKNYQGSTTSTTTTTAASMTIPTRRDSLSSLKKNALTSVSSCATTATSCSLTSAPMLSSSKSGRGSGKKKRRGSNSSSSSTKISHLNSVTGGKSSGRLRCIHCQDSFRAEENERGSCEYAPDCMKSAIDTVSCIGCAECLLYHCYADAEGDYATNPNSQGHQTCSGIRRQSQQHHQGCCSITSSPKRWFGLALLSLVVPCLWCYLPLRACYRCGVKCRCCGQPHEAA